MSPTEASPLSADGGGTLSITNRTVANALASDEQSVQLLSDALKVFYFNGLTMTIDIPLMGNGRIGLSVQGKNPAVLEGYPFDINVNLESKFHDFIGLQQAVVVALSHLLLTFQ